MSITLQLPALAACGIKPPAEAIRWLDIAEALRREAEVDAQRLAANVHHFTDQITTDNAGTILDSLTRAKVDADVRQLLARQLIEATENRASQAIRAAADNLIAAARSRFDKAAAALTKAAGEFDPSDTPEQVMARGGKAPAAWATMQEASTVLDACIQLLSILAESAPVIESAVATFDGDHWRRVDGQALFEQPNRWHALVRAGYTLRLNTQAEAAELLSQTPERTMRTELVRKDGFRAFETVRG